MIKLDGVSKKFKRKVVLENVNLEIESGETVGFIGPNGCGKSVLFKLMIGFLVADAGTVVVDGKTIGKKGEFADNVGALINGPGYIGSYSGFDNLKFLASISNKATDDMIVEYMKMLGLNPDDKTKVKDYSLGMKQKLGIAQAIMEDNDIVILDEPFNGLDYMTRNDVVSTIKKLKENRKTVLLTAHYLQDIRDLCDKVYIIRDYNVYLADEEELALFANNN